MGERDIVERLREKALEPTEIVMKQWDQIRHQIEVLPGASLPRDSFEALVDWLVEDCSEAAAEILRLRAELAARAVPDEELMKTLCVHMREASPLAAIDASAPLASPSSARRRTMSGKKIVAGMREAVERAKQDVADAVAIHKEAYRAGWIAGRDAAAERMREPWKFPAIAGPELPEQLAEIINALEPPA